MPKADGNGKARVDSDVERIRVRVPVEFLAATSPALLVLAVLLLDYVPVALTFVAIDIVVSTYIAVTAITRLLNRPSRMTA